jgi:hypothetical protein
MILDEDEVEVMCWVQDWVGWEQKVDLEFKAEFGC